LRALLPFTFFLAVIVALDDGIRAKMLKKEETVNEKRRKNKIK
jgi:hypothetical protein